MRSKDIFRYGAPFLVVAAATACQIGNKENTPGGIWHKPEDGAVAHKTIVFEARAYPAGHRDPEVDFVIFTASWEGRNGPWIVACKVPRPKEGDVYNCNWNPNKYPEPVPAGRLNISFDVQDKAGNRTEAPNGVRKITYAP